MKQRFEEPTRWLDARSDAPDDVRRLLEGGRDALSPTDEQMARLASFAASAAAGGAGGAAAGATKGAAVLHGSHALAKAGVVKVIAVLAVGGATAGVGWTALRSTGSRAPAPIVQPSIVQPSTPVAAEAPTTAAPPSAASVVARPDDDDAPSPPTASPSSTTPPAVAIAPSRDRTVPIPSSPATPLPPPVAPSAELPSAASAAQVIPQVAPPAPAGESELALLDRARSVLPSDPGETLRVLDEHRASYPRGVLAQEREVLAIEALVRLGRRPEAEARAAAFMRDYPGSAHRRRIGVLLGDDGGR